MQCWVHVYRRVCCTAYAQVPKKIMQTFYPGIKAIKNSRSLAQAKAIGQVVLAYMKDKGCLAAANKFEKSYLSDKWLTWFIGCVGAGFTPTTNPIESWHKIIKGQPGIGRFGKATDNLMCTTFPLIVRYDTDFRCGAVTVRPPDILPSEYLDEALQLADLSEEQAYLVGSDCFYVKYDWTTSVEKARKKVTAKWAAAYERGLRGDLKPTTRLSTVTNHYLGLCKVSVPEADSEDNEYSCDCDIYNLYLCCSHSIFVRMKLGNLDVDSLTTKMGRIRGVGRPRRSRGALDKTDDGPLRRKRKNETSKDRAP